jgi:peptidoglycan/xylan/chitin deacetylase (PgdA/CDA1 family)
MGTAPRAIPVIMYHNVGRDYPGWPWNFLVTPLEVFEGQMRILKDRGWTTITLDELHAHVESGSSVPEKSIVLTFDDGYRDNYVHAFPILKKYGHRAVIWMSTDFVDPRADCPPTLEDVWAGRVSMDGLDARGYLSWAEMRRMVASGLVDIQSHAMTHTWYFGGPEIVDFHRPDGVDGYRAPLWLAWNKFPGEKYKSMHERMEERIPYGEPIYRSGKSFAVRRYFEDAGLTSRLAAFVAEEGGAGFFSRGGWREKLEAVARDYGPRADRFETPEEHQARVRAELVESRETIEAALGTKVRYLCWPGGAHGEEVRAIAGEAGYLATTTLFEDPVKKNIFGEDPREINRIGSGSPWIWRGKIIKNTGPEFFIAAFDLFAGKRFSIWKYRCYKLLYALRYCIMGDR